MGGQRQVDANQAVGEPMAQLPGDDGPPVSSLGGEALVAEHVGHELDPQLRGAAPVHAGRSQWAREAVARQRRHYDVEGVRQIAAVLLWMGERPDQLRVVPEGPGPAVGEHDRQRAVAGALLVQVVNADAVDLDPVVAVRVHRRLVAAPVVVVPPVVDELTQVGAVGSVAPVVVVEVLGEARAGEAVAQVGEVGVGNLDRERLGLHADKTIRSDAEVPSRPTGSRRRWLRGRAACRC